MEKENLVLIPLPVQPEKTCLLCVVVMTDLMLTIRFLIQLQI
jgi:hypothetical protein